jgi:HprK-related kinase A
VVAIHSPIEALHLGVERLYGQYEVAPDDAFVDFEVSIKRPRGLRRWVHQQAVFEFDGHLPFTPLPADQAFPMLEWGLNWCISSHCHRYLMIHSAVVERQGGAILLPAPPGSGKSTLCAALVHSGWRLLSDELALIDPRSGMIAPVPRPVSLKNASIEVMQRFAPQAVFSRVVHDTSKGNVAHMRPPADSLRRVHETAQPRWLVFPRFDAASTTRLVPVSKARALVQLIDNSFNFQVHGPDGLATLAQVIDRSDCFELTFNSLESALELLDDLAPAERSPQ